MQSGQNPSVGSRVKRLGGKLGLLRADLEGRQAGGFWSLADGTYQCVRACCSCVGAVGFGWRVGKEMSWVMKTILMEKGRGDSGSEMWNQVLLGNGRVESSGGGPYAPTPASYKFHSHPYPFHVASASSLSIPIPDLTLLPACP